MLEVSVSRKLEDIALELFRKGGKGKRAEGRHEIMAGERGQAGFKYVDLAL